MRQPPVQLARDIAPKARAQSPSPPAKKQKKVAFDEEPPKYCIKDFTEHYKIVTALPECRVPCRYTHYNKVQRGITEEILLTAVHQIIDKLGLTDAQVQQFSCKN
jgi:hypothetical protein